MKTNSVWILICMTALLICAAVSQLHAQQPLFDGQQPLFEKALLFEKVRIPKITVATDGTVLAFARSCGLYRYSKDGGKTWSETEALESKGGNAIVDEDTEDILIVSSRHGFLLRSRDRRKTWPVKRLVYEGPSAYSSLAADKNGTIFLLFENGTKQPYERISLARFNLEWLTQRQDWQDLLED